jgi:hypothetical protein
VLIVMLTGVIGEPGAAVAQETPRERAAQAAPDPRALQLEDERRDLEGRSRTLDRELAPYDRDRLRRPPPDQPTGRVRGGQRDPLMERRDLERRSLRDRQHLLEQRQLQYERRTGRGR